MMEMTRHDSFKKVYSLHFSSARSLQSAFLIHWPSDSFPIHPIPTPPSLTFIPLVENGIWTTYGNFKDFHKQFSCVRLWNRDVFVNIGRFLLFLDQHFHALRQCRHFYRFRLIAWWLELTEKQSTCNKGRESGKRRFKKNFFWVC